MGLLFPMLWAMSASRWAAFAMAAAYSMTVVRFLPGLAGNWFGSPALGLLCWTGVGTASGAFWGLLRPKQSAVLPEACATLAGLLLSLLPPMGALFPGHPVVCWGFLLPGWGWAGVATMTVVTVIVTTVIGYAKSFRSGAAAAWIVLAAAAVALSAQGATTAPDSGEPPAGIVGIKTAWGGFPAYGSVEVAERLRRIGNALDDAGLKAARTVVVPEAIIGLYDESLDNVIELEVVRRIRRTGQTVVLGADVRDGDGRFRNIALVLRPDGSRSIVSARQTTPVAQWRPWSDTMHFPANWLASSTVTVGDNLQARIMFCHEEWMPVLHLLSEAREEQQLVIAVANLWATQDPLASHLQGAHTEGMARLFGRQFARAVNDGKTLP